MPCLLDTMTIPDPNRAAVSWSGGKDACLARLRALEAGWRVDTLVTMCETDGTSKAHALAPAILAAQADALGAALRTVPVAPGDYVRAFDATLGTLRADGHTAMVFGDIDLQAHRDWLQAACDRAGLQALFPLWRQPRAALAREVVARGIRARLVCVDRRWLGPEWCGRAYDAALLDTLPDGVCPCGEDGEFHTLVWDGPGFRAPLRLVSRGIEEVDSVPPLSPTRLVFDRLALAQV